VLLGVKAIISECYPKCMATIPYSRSGMDPLQQARRERKKAHAKAQRRYARTHREEISARNRQRYLAKKQRAERLAWKVIREANERAEREALLASVPWDPPELTLREVWDLNYLEVSELATIDVVCSLPIRLPRNHLVLRCSIGLPVHIREFTRHRVD
jgi:hypothetical protein